jgi:GDP-mannose pyrophosphatase NudK
MKPIHITNQETLSYFKYHLSKVTYEYLDRHGQAKAQTKEIYNRGNGAAILLYNPEKRTVILTRQFRLAAHLNHRGDGMLIEACAGQLDGENPEEAMIRETREETGYRIQGLKKIFEAYTTPGSVTETLHFYIAVYSDEMKVNEGGGLEEEGEDIEVLELGFDKACEMVANGQIKDCKTIMLLQYAQVHRLLEV